MIETKIDQTGFVPSYSVCIYCGAKCKNETCSGVCGNKIKAVRNAIQNQIEIDKVKNKINRVKDRKEWTEKTIRQFNQLTDILEGE